MRRALHLTLIALIVVTSLSLGMARGQARVAGQVVLCAGAVVTVQPVDAGGQPVRQAQVCPDMALSLAMALTVPPAVVQRPMDVRAARVVPQARTGTGRGLRPRQGRGPPPPA